MFQMLCLMFLQYVDSENEMSLSPRFKISNASIQTLLNCRRTQAETDTGAEEGSSLYL